MVAAMKLRQIYRVSIPDGSEIDGIPVKALPCLPADSSLDGCRMSEIPNLSILTYYGEQSVGDQTLHIFEVDGFRVLVGDGILNYVRQAYQRTAAASGKRNKR